MASTPYALQKAAQTAADARSSIDRFSEAENALHDQNLCPVLIGGIALAGAVYPTVAATVFCCVVTAVEVFEFLFGVGRSLTVLEILLRAPESVLIVMLVGSVLGFFYAALACLAILPLAYFCAKSLRLRVKATWFGAVCGGLVGFVTVTPLILFGPYGIDWAFLLLWIVVGPALATPLGQLGGAWGSSKAHIELWPQHDDCSRSTQDRWYQFDIKQMLWFSTWLALLLAAIHLLGIPFELFLPILLGWLIYQTATLWLGWMAIRRLQPKWQAYRIRRFT